MNELDLLQKDLTPEEIEEITGSEKHIVQAIKQQRCTEAFTQLRQVLPDMTGVMMEDVKRHINLEMKRRREQL